MEGNPAVARAIRLFPAMAYIGLEIADLFFLPYASSVT